MPLTGSPLALFGLKKRGLAMFTALCRFFAGVAACVAMIQLSLSLGGGLPLNLFGIVITPDFNSNQTFVSIILSILLIYGGWLRR
jgi:hypothetical protein